MSKLYKTARAAIADVRLRAESCPDPEILAACISEIRAISKAYSENIDKGLSREEYVKIVDSVNRAEQYFRKLDKE